MVKYRFHLVGQLTADLPASCLVAGQGYFVIWVMKYRFHLVGQLTADLPASCLAAGQGYNGNNGKTMGEH